MTVYLKTPLLFNIFFINLFLQAFSVTSDLNNDNLALKRLKRQTYDQKCFYECIRGPLGEKYNQTATTANPSILHYMFYVQLINQALGGSGGRGGCGGSGGCGDGSNGCGTGCGGGNGGCGGGNGGCGGGNGGCGGGGGCEGNNRQQNGDFQFLID